MNVVYQLLLSLWERSGDEIAEVRVLSLVIIPNMDSDPKRAIDPAVRQRARELRQQQTTAEEKLWALLRDRRLGNFKFRRQVPYGRFILDFFCGEVGVVVELDGGVHQRQKDYDQARDEWLAANGLTVLRFENKFVIEDFDRVAKEILRICQESIGKRE